MDKRIDQAITNLQTICNLSFDNDTVCSIASSTADLLGSAADRSKPLMDDEFFDLVSQFLAALDAESPHPAEEIPPAVADSLSHRLGEEIGYMLQDYFTALGQWKQTDESQP